MIVMFLLLPQGSEPKVPHLSGQGNAPGSTEAATGFASALSKAVAGLVTVLLLFGCDLVGQAPDPAMVQQQIEALRTQEREVVRNTIVDPARADRFLHLVAERDQLIAQSREALEAYRDQMSALNADYHADRAGFESLLADFNTRREHAQAQFVSIISRMKAEATAEEWKEIAAFQTKRLNPRELTYRQAEEGG